MECIDEWCYQEYIGKWKNFHTEYFEFLETINDEINKKFTTVELECAYIWYENRKHNVTSEIKKYNDAQKLKERKKALLYMSGVLKKDDDFENLLSICRKVSEPVLKYIIKCESIIKEIGKANLNKLVHVSHQCLDFVNSSVNRENMYRNEFGNYIFATSSPLEVALYACRAVTKYLIVKDDMCIFSANPFADINSQKYTLKEKSYICSLNIDDFTPVIDFNKEKNGSCFMIAFGEEWVAKSSKLECKHVWWMDSIDINMLNQLELFYINDVELDDKFDGFNPDFDRIIQKFIEEERIIKIEDKEIYD